MSNKINLNKVKTVLDLYDKNLFRELHINPSIGEVSEEELADHLTRLERKGLANTSVLNLKLKAVLEKVNSVMGYGERKRNSLVDMNLRKGMESKEFQVHEASMKRLSEGRNHLIRFMNVVDRVRKRPR